ncbi:MAG: GYD domain-containing protein [Thermodesulfobacteriota bacterium]
MAKYIMMSVLTDEGRKTMKMRPERIKEVNKEIEKMGVEVLTQYAVIGPYDFVNIVEAPDNETITKVSTELGARGTVQIMTLAAIPIADFEKQLSKKSKKPSKKN